MTKQIRIEIEQNSDEIPSEIKTVKSTRQNRPWIPVILKSTKIYTWSGNKQLYKCKQRKHKLPSFKLSVISAERTIYTPKGHDNCIFFAMGDNYSRTLRQTI
jgi:hypothetical protein